MAPFYDKGLRITPSTDVDSTEPICVDLPVKGTSPYPNCNDFEIVQEGGYLKGFFLRLTVFESGRCR